MWEANAVPIRELIYELLRSFCSEVRDAHLCDPSLFLKGRLHLLHDDGIHFTDEGHAAYFEYLTSRYIEPLSLGHVPGDPPLESTCDDESGL